MALLIFFTLALYLLSIVLFWHRIKQSTPTSADGVRDISPGNRPAYQLLVTVIALLHSVLLFKAAVHGNELNIALGHVFSLVCLMTVIVFLAGSLTRHTLNLGALVMPLGLAGLITGQYFTGSSHVIQDAPVSLWLHLVIALLAFSILCIAAAQALLLYLQEKQLHSSNPGALFPALPALETMESNLFFLTLIGALLLTANLLIGMVSSFQVHGRTLVFNHHILLSFIAWLGFTGLLVGHRIYGWRGGIAAKWTMIAFFILFLAYFGTRFVKSTILTG